MRGFKYLIAITGPWTGFNEPVLVDTQKGIILLQYKMTTIKLQVGMLASLRMRFFFQIK